MHLTQAGPYLLSVYLDSASPPALIGQHGDGPLLPKALSVLPGPADAEATTLELEATQIPAGGNVTGFARLFDTYGNRWQYSEGNPTNFVEGSISGDSLETAAYVVFDQDLQAFLITARMEMAGEYLFQVGTLQVCPFKK